MNTVYPYYGFNASAKEVTLVGIEVDLSRVRGIFNQTRGAIYFAPGIAGYALTRTAPNVINLNASVDTTGHANTDSLLVLYDWHEDNIDVWRTTFAGAYTNAVDPFYWGLRQTGAGMTVNQTGGNLLITCGTTTNSETIIRSVRPFSGSHILRFIATLTQRNANNNCIVELVDLVGDGLSYTINSATSVTVTFPSVNPFAAPNVGQQLHIGQITGAAGIPLLATIASVSGLTVTLTVAGWPASGSGTCSLFGRNAIEFRYTGTTTTVISMRTRRNGYQTAEDITVNTTTTAHQIESNFLAGVRLNLSDRLITSLATGISTLRGDRVANLPDEDTEMYLQIRSLNGTSAPTATTWTLGIMSVSDYAVQPVSIVQSEPAARQQTETTGTVALSALPALVAGSALAGDVGVQVRANATGAATPFNINSPATPIGQSIKGASGRLFSLYFRNSNAASRWLKVFNATSVTMGTTAAILDIEIPPNSTGITYPIPDAGLGFSTGIFIAVTAGKGLTNNAAITSDDVSGGGSFA